MSGQLYLFLCLCIREYSHFLSFLKNFDSFFFRNPISICKVNMNVLTPNGYGTQNTYVLTKEVEIFTINGIFSETQNPTRRLFYQTNDNIPTLNNDTTIMVLITSYLYLLVTVIAILLLHKHTKNLRPKVFLIFGIQILHFVGCECHCKFQYTINSFF